MRVLNRGLLLLVPGQPYLDWANGLPDHGPDYELEQATPAAYLIPEFGTLEEVNAFVEANYEALFEEELAAWTEDRSVWPEPRSLESFWEWFTVEYTDLVADLADEPIRTEEV